MKNKRLLGLAVAAGLVALVVWSLLPQSTVTQSVTPAVVTDQAQSEPGPHDHAQVLQAASSEPDAAYIDHSLPPISKAMKEEIRRLGNRSTEGLVEVQHPDGSASVDLQGRFRSVTAAVRDENGNIVIRHGGDLLAAPDAED